MKFERNIEQEKIDALAEFAAGAGHEINNPLTIIRGRAQILLQEIDHPDHRKHLATILNQVQRAYEMIADIRLFARPPKPEWESMDLAETLRNVVREQSELGSPEMIWELVVPESVPIHSDPVILHTVFAILCKNAREALGTKPGILRITCTAQDHQWKISVEDNGPGIPKEIGPLIFSPYFSGRQAGRGLGFGLPKAWRFLEQINGTISLADADTFAGHSTPGACFEITLPVEGGKGYVAKRKE